MPASYLLASSELYPVSIQVDCAQGLTAKVVQDEDDLSNETEGQLQDLEREIAALNSRLGSQAPGMESSCKLEEAYCRSYRL